MAYKADIDDYRESPAIDVIEILKREGADTDFFDPYIPSFKDKGVTYTGIEKISPEVIASYDLVVITANHTNVDYEMIQKNAKAIFDAKNAMASVKDRENIEFL